MITKEEAIKAYDQLIQLRRTKQLIRSKENPGKVETHHILPRSCRGEDILENRIELYAKEHFMAHVYLWIIHHDDEFHFQTMHALNMMVKGTLNGSRKELRDFILQSEEYQKARQESATRFSKISSKINNGQNNPNFGNSWIYNNDLHLSICIPIDLLFWDYIANGWIKGRKCYNHNTFQKISNFSKDTCWIVNVEMTQQKHIKKFIAEKFIASGKWKLGRLPCTNKEKLSEAMKAYHLKMNHNSKRYEKCVNCGNDNPNKYAKFCSRECKLEYKLKLLNEKVFQHRKEEAAQIEKEKHFRAQITKLYKGIIDRKQVKRYFEFKKCNCCAKCGKTDVKLTLHAKDGNCRNLAIDNYELLCKECYLAP